MNITKFFLGHNLSPLFLRANVPVRRPIIREIRETMALRTIIDNVKINITQDSTIEIGIGEYLRQNSERVMVRSLVVEKGERYDQLGKCLA